MGASTSCPEAEDILAYLRMDHRHSARPISTDASGNLIQSRSMVVDLFDADLPAPERPHDLKDTAIPSGHWPEAFLPDMPASCKGLFTDLRSAFSITPMRYEDRRRTVLVQDFQNGELAHVVGVIQEIEIRPGKGQRDIWILHCQDSAHAEFHVSFFVITPYHEKILKTGVPCIFQGKPKSLHGRWYISQPALLEARDMGALIPIYRRQGKWGSHKIHGAFTELFRTFSDLQMDAQFPKAFHALLQNLQLPGPAQALRAVHQPEDIDLVASARDTLKVLEIAQFMQQPETAPETRTPLSIPVAQADLWESLFSFSLTPSQKKAWRAIQQTLTSGRVMNVLLQGGVSSGKTAIAYLAAIAQVQADAEDRLAVIVAPTKILADQLFCRLKELVTPVLPELNVVRGQTRRRFSWPEWGIVVGTHGVVGPAAPWDRIGLVVFDEEHRYGADTKSIPASVHRLLMSATPIPATLGAIRFSGMQILRLQASAMGRNVESVAMTRKASGPAIRAVQDTVATGGKAIIVYGTITAEELPPIPQHLFIQSPGFGTDRVVLAQGATDYAHALQAAKSAGEDQCLPFVRLSKDFDPARWMATKGSQDLFSFPLWLLHPHQKDRLHRLEREDLFYGTRLHTRTHLLNLCANGVLTTLPLVRESQIRRGLDMEGAIPFWRSRFPEQLTILHGQCRPEEREAALEAFTSGRCPVLLATSIVEVGIDIEGVDTLIVANADRMGVASLVQLRGRVGRRGKKGTCYFIAQEEGESLERLHRIAHEKQDDVLAEMDFLERGLGDLQQGMQSGHRFQHTRLPEDYDLLCRVSQILGKTAANPCCNSAVEA